MVNSGKPTILGKIYWEICYSRDIFWRAHAVHRLAQMAVRRMRNICLAHLNVQPGLKAPFWGILLFGCKSNGFWSRHLERQNCLSNSDSQFRHFPWNFAKRDEHKRLPYMSYAILWVVMCELPIYYIIRFESSNDLYCTFSILLFPSAFFSRYILCKEVDCFCLSLTSWRLNIHEILLVIIVPHVIGM
jgi:hypothetical protein